MNVWDKIFRPAALTSSLDDRFTAKETQRLTALRRRVAVQPVHLDLGIDLRRLEFARWLVDHGRLSEELSQGERFAGTPEDGVERGAA